MTTGTTKTPMTNFVKSVADRFILFSGISVLALEMPTVIHCGVQARREIDRTSGHGRGRDDGRPV
jgi:hypothetical protein